MIHYELLCQTAPDWVHTACSDFNAFLIDHASCERKASSVGLSFVVRYPDRPKIIDPMIQFAREELDHFHQVFRLMDERGLSFQRDEQDNYVNTMMEQVRFGREERLLDRLIIASLIEARGHERLELVAEHLKEPLKTFYQRLARAERRHRDLFLEMAELYFLKADIKLRVDQLLPVEAQAIQAAAYRSALH